MKIIENIKHRYATRLKFETNENYRKHKTSLYKSSEIRRRILNPIQDRHFWGCSRMGREGGKKGPLPKICHTYPSMMKLGTVIPYPKKIKKIYESRDISPEFC